MPIKSRYGGAQHEVLVDWTSYHHKTVSVSRDCSERNRGSGGGGGGHGLKIERLEIVATWRDKASTI